MTKRRSAARLFSRFLAAGRGGTAVEYALIAGFLSIAIAVLVNEIGVDLAAIFADVKGGF